MLRRGTVVVSLKGHDQGTLMCVLGVNEKAVLVCDGRERKLSKPKSKNPKHIRPLDRYLSEEQLRTDKQIRKALKLIAEE
ncbi:MAG: KOW domain-containing protein [Ruminococcaceae bacterium]|nr:KOW domain-containing protein [Oscillospiraceae bacterium]